MRQRHVVDVEASEVMKKLTLEVTVRMRGMLRVRAGMWLVALGATLMGCHCEIRPRSEA